MKTRLACLVVGVKRQQIIYFWDVTSLGHFGLRFGFGWVFLQFHMVTLFNISHNLLKCLVCINLHICFSELFGLPRYEFFGRRGMTVCLITRLRHLLSSSKRLNWHLFYGKSPNGQLLCIAIMTGGINRSIVWASTCNFCLFVYFDGALLWLFARLVRG